MSSSSFSIQEIQCAHPGGLHQMIYFEWGPTNEDGPILPRRTLICVHGLSRNARDFDKLARYMASQHGYRVICPDIVGHGWSDRLKNPQGYVIPQYVSDMATLIARRNLHRVQWLGTSLGGLTGMGLACLKYSPISRLILNDVGPHLTFDALRYIGDFLEAAPIFEDLTGVEQYLRKIHDSFNPLSNEDWHHITKHSAEKTEDGRWRLRFDPKLVQPFRQAYVKGITDVIDPALLPSLDLWPIYKQIRCPTLVLRGEKSLVLSKETADRMAETGPKAIVHEFPQVGHAPMFMNDEQISVVSDFLLAEKEQPGARYSRPSLWQAS